MSQPYVMVIEDDGPLRDSVCELLEEDGWATSCLDSGASALDRLRQTDEKPDLILLDLMMPVMNGWQFRTEQLHDPTLAKIPVVVMTASRDLKGIQADDIIYKPLRLKRLLEVVRRYTRAAPDHGRAHAKGTQGLDPVSVDSAGISSPHGAPAMPMSKHSDIFAGGGELGGRMAAMDWSKNPLGPVERWPQSLRTCVRIILTSRQPMFIWWGEHLINLYNDAYRSIIGGKHPHALGQPASVVWSEIWNEIRPRANAAMLQNEGTYDESLLLIMERHGYQEETYYTFSYSPVPNDLGGTGGIICANTDDTERIISERQLAVLRDLASRTADKRSLEEVCQQTTGALDTDPKDIPFAVLYLASDDRSTFELHGVLRVQSGSLAAPLSIARSDGTTWPLGDVIERQETIVVADLADRLPPLPKGAWDRAPSHAAVVPIAPSGEDGRPGVLVVGLNPFRGFDEKYRAFVELVAGQISASLTNAQAYEAERKRAEALAEIDRAKTAFFSNISHEFRTPLTLMLGPTGDLLSGSHGAVTIEQREQLELLYRNELRLQKLVNSLLDFSRIEAGRIQAAYEPLDLAMLTRDLASSFRSAIERAGLELKVDCPALGCPCFVDRDMWEKIVLNLLSNAFKFTFKGTITVSLAEENDSVSLRVSDTGVGVPTHELPRLFERFYRIEGMAARTHEGSGIGLALVEELAKLHGGAISAESELGMGTTFTVTIPTGSSHLPKEHIGRRRAAAANDRNGRGVEAFVGEALRWLPKAATDFRQEGSPRVSASAQGTAWDKTQARILVADDNADMRDYLRRLLEHDWLVEVVEDGATALASVRRQPPDLVLTDVMMPRLDGFGLLRELRRDASTKHIPVVMLSARAGEEAEVEGLEAGADAYLVKPFSARELLVRVRAHLEIARLQGEIRAQKEHLYAVFMQAPAPICVLRGRDLVYEMANELYLKVSGKRDLVGRPLLEALPDLVGQGLEEILWGVMDTGKPFVATEKLVRLDRNADGQAEDAYWTFIYAPMRSSAEKVERVLVFCNDVTDQVIARQAIENSEERFRQLVTQVQAGIAQTDLDGRFTLTNERYREIVGRSDQELKQLRVKDITHADDLAQNRSHLQRLVEKGIPFISENRFIKPDGSIVWIQNSVSRIDDHDGRAQGIASVTIDITQRKYAERALKESEKRFRAIFETAEVSLWDEDFSAIQPLIVDWKREHGAGLRKFLEDSPAVVDAAIGMVRLRDVNPATLRMFAASSKEQLLGSLHKIFIPETRPVFIEEIIALAEGRPIFESEATLRTLSGERIDVLLTMSFVDRDGKCDRVLVSLMDISPQKAAQREKEARLVEVERAVRFSELFTGILGHDLRNPLSAITSAADLLSRRAEDIELIAKPVGRILTSADRMERMISQLLDFTRIRLGRGIPLERQPIDLRELCRPLLEEVEAVWNTDIELRSTGDLGGHWDADRLSQLISNLAGNACQHRVPGTPIRIHLDGQRPSEVRIEIQNEGAISPDILPALFEPLRETGEGQHKRPGSSGLGLGLYITQQIALAHGGEIHVRSDQADRGLGTSFIVTLPRTTVPEENQSFNLSAPPPTATPS